MVFISSRILLFSGKFFDRSERSRRVIFDTSTESIDGAKPAGALFPLIERKNKNDMKQNLILFILQYQFNNPQKDQCNPGEVTYAHSTGLYLLALENSLYTKSL
jgi:hypothetical protein